MTLLGACAVVGMLVVSSMTSGHGNAEARVRKGFLTFVTVKDMKVRGAYEEIGTIWTADLDGANRRHLAAGNVPDISPDGEWIAFVDRANQLQIIASEGGASRLVVRKPSRYAFGWAPDSRRLGVVIGGLLAVIAWARKTGKLTPTFGGYDIYRASTIGGGIRRLTHDRGSYKPIWGPRGIAFARFELFTLLHPQIELWQVRRDGEGLRRVSGKNLAPFGWSGDGRRLLAYGETEVTVSLCCRPVER